MIAVALIFLLNISYQNNKDSMRSKLCVFSSLISCAPPLPEKGKAKDIFSENYSQPKRIKEQHKPINKEKKM